MGTERRFAKGIEVREAAKDSGAIAVLVGYAAVFNSRSLDLGGFRESIRPGAFTEVLAAGQDVRALVGHDPRKIIGRRSAGTLKLEEDTRGLHYEVMVPDTQEGRDVVTSIRRGDIDGSSFMFDVRSDGEAWSREKEVGLLREIVKVSELIDVGPVTFPAYTETTVEARSHLEAIAKAARSKMGTDAHPRRDRLLRRFKLVTGVDLPKSKV